MRQSRGRGTLRVLLSRQRKLQVRQGFERGAMSDQAFDVIVT
jgi:hypothetical protein